MEKPAELILYVFSQIRAKCPNISVFRLLPTIKINMKNARPIPTVTFRGKLQKTHNLFRPYFSNFDILMYILFGEKCSRFNSMRYVKQYFQYYTIFAIFNTKY